MSPTQTPLAQIQALETEFAEAMTRLYAVGNGLARVRNDLAHADLPAMATAGVATRGAARASAETATTTPAVASVGTAPVAPASPAPVGPPAEGTTPDITAAPEPSAGASGPLTPPPIAAAPAPRWWERPGAVAKVLGAVGAVVTLIGVAFLLAIAIAAGIFGPVPRTVAGALLAVGLVVGGVLVRRRSAARPTDDVGDHGAGGRISGGEALVATGLAAAYLDLLAATAVYGFIPDWAGLTLAGLVSAGTFFLARRWNSQLLAVLAAAPPMLLAPAVAGIASPATLSFVSILLVASAAAHLGRAWPWLYAARAIPGVLIIVSCLASWQGSSFTMVTITAATALGMVLAGATEQSRKHAALPLYAALAAAVPLALAVSTLTGDRLAVAAMLAALFLTVAGLVERLTERLFASRWVWIAPLATGTVLLIMAAQALPAVAQSGTALAVASGAYLFMATWQRNRPVAAMGGLLAVTSAMAFLPTLMATVTASHLIATFDPVSILHALSLTALAGLTLVAGRALSDGRLEAVLTKGAAAVAFVTGSATIVLLGTWIGHLNEEPRLGFYGGHAVATALWTALAALLMTVVARRSHDRGLMIRIGLALIAIAIGKLFLFDLAALSGLFRVVAFVVTGIIVLVLGVVVAQEQTRSQPAADEVTPPEDT